MTQEGVKARVERKLAAILAADVVAYNRLMGADEEGTLARLNAHQRELIDAKIKQRQGRIVKTTGDGMLVESHRLSRRGDGARGRANRFTLGELQLRAASRPLAPA
jgi:class 3 adenylate cyclase